jgi:hypothetical protein
MVANTVATAAAPASAAKSRKQVGDFGDMAFPPGVMFRFWIAPAEASVAKTLTPKAGRKGAFGANPDR